MHSGEAVDKLLLFSDAWPCESMRAFSEFVIEIERVGTSRTRTWMGMDESYGWKSRSRVIYSKEHGRQHSCTEATTTIDFGKYHFYILITTEAAKLNSAAA